MNKNFVTDKVKLAEYRLMGYQVETTDDSQHWYLNNQRHREDGPAVLWADGEMWWYNNGMLHRESGPAIVHANGSQFWWLNGKAVTVKEFNERNKNNG